MPHRILLVEDDLELSRMVADFLTNENYIVDIEANGLQAISRIRSTPYDAIVLDIGLPGTDGISVCRTVRGDFEGPILILTARGDEIDEVVALEVGADDYMSKPVRPRALLARLKMHLQRTETGLTSAVDSPLVVNGLAIDASSRLVQLDGQAISLTTAEFDLIWYLAERAGKVVHRSEIYQALVGIPFDGLDRSIDLRVSRLRKKIGDDPIHPTRIKSVRGVGYILAIQS